MPDLDHFKEFNDRYSYYAAIASSIFLSRILHDVSKACWGPGGSWPHRG